MTIPQPLANRTDLQTAKWRLHNAYSWEYLTEQGRCLGQVVRSNTIWIVYVHFENKTTKIASHWDLNIAKVHLEDFWKDLI